MYPRRISTPAKKLKVGLGIGLKMANSSHDKYGHGVIRGSVSDKYFNDFSHPEIQCSWLVENEIVILTSRDPKKSKS